MARLTRTKGAVALNVHRLLGDRDSGFLWTLTTPEKVELVELSRRWNLFRRWFEARGYRCVRVFEPHPKGHGWHVHFVTERWLDVRVIRLKAEGDGFGRINVRSIAKRCARYLAKYLGKNFRGPRPRGARMWACVGFKGSSAKNVRVRTRILHGHWMGDHWEMKPWPPHLNQFRWVTDANGRMALQEIWRPPAAYSEEVRDKMRALPLGCWRDDELLLAGWTKLAPTDEDLRRAAEESHAVAASRNEA